VPPGTGLAAVVVLCVAQLVVQLVYFLHIGSARSQRANTGIFVCTGFLIAVIVGLSLWVMHNANINMMPTHLTVERAIAHD
jgi:cytochrome o ubiquinol oxidase subunit IV